MGYFNIFYKITRIIDFFTRKRNRKFILALCLIAAFVFFSPNMIYAQYTNLDSQNLQNIRTKINEIDSTLDTYISDIYTSVYSMDLDVETIKIRVGGMADNVNTIRTDVTRMAGYLITVRDTLTDVDSEIEDLLSKIDDLNLKIDNINTVLVNINDTIQDASDLNHQDLEELKNIIKEYLYGDILEYPVTYGTIYNLAVDDYSGTESQGKFITSNAGAHRILYFKLHSGYHYDIDFSFIGNEFQNNKLKYGFTNEPPANNVAYIDCTRVTPTTQSIDFQAENDNYFYIYYDRYYYGNFAIISDYNEGQEQGIYGGMTTINQTTINQGEQTRDTISEESEATRNTITNTDYNQNVVSVDTTSVDSISSTQTQGLFTTIFNSFNSAATGGVNSIVIPLPHGNSITLYSNVVSSHLGNLSALVSAFWYFVFGLYAFKFVNNLIRSIKTGDILSGFNSSNEVISKDIL